MKKPRVGVIMGSDSDWPAMEDAAKALSELGVEHEVTVVSAHRTPQRLVDYARSAEGRGLKVIIAGAGGSAHLPGMTAALTPLPVVGVPVRTRQLDGLDSLLSIVQMPAGIPVATVAINGSRNAGLLAAQILALGDAALAKRLKALRGRSEAKVLAIAKSWKKKGPAASAQDSKKRPRSEGEGTRQAVRPKRRRRRRARNP